mmetsp:Transcript_30019/g.54895  ORF Transcript_30019/g.54895 Transcript_30019/m.54895 type:complete len:92 (+) Transcript_30019:91-366(+)
MSSPQEKTATLPDHILRMINGEVSPEDKKEMYNNSLHNWWMEYSARKNNEEEEHVSDSLLYDERCHLPRTVAPPACVAERKMEEAAKASPQ